mmetsp:Transcript_16853/g.55194  ORF Transcript_16853/g.55194 Transcript_16853/m.55194 type:complete len:105 (+) Transcript_16853:187-501(+)
MASPATGSSRLGWCIFLLSLGLLLLLKVAGSKRHLFARLGVLGLGLGGLAFHFTASAAAALTTTVLVWSPLPLLLWRRRRRAEPTKPRSQFFKTNEAVCQPCQS